MIDFIELHAPELGPKQPGWLQDFNNSGYHDRVETLNGLYAAYKAVEAGSSKEEELFNKLMILGSDEWETHAIGDGESSEEYSRDGEIIGEAIYSNGTRYGEQAGEYHGSYVWPWWHNQHYREQRR